MQLFFRKICNSFLIQGFITVYRLLSVLLLTVELHFLSKRGTVRLSIPLAYSPCFLLTTIILYHKNGKMSSGNFAQSFCGKRCRTMQNAQNGSARPPLSRRGKALTRLNFDSLRLECRSIVQPLRKSRE